MALWLDLLIFCLGPVLVLGGFVAALHWLLDRIFGSDSYEIGFAQRMQADFFQKANFFAERKERESKENPHYDALVDEEWRALRLEDESHELDAEEELSLGELLERKR